MFRKIQQKKTLRKKLLPRIIQYNYFTANAFKNIYFPYLKLKRMFKYLVY